MDESRPLMRRSRPAWLAKGKLPTSRDSKGAWAAVPERLVPWTRVPAIRRARWILPVAAGLLVAVVVTPFAIGEGGRAALAAAVKDPASLLAQRSPGERAPGAMHSTKPPRLASARALPGPRERVLPQERVLPNERVREPATPLADAPETGLPVIDAPIEVAQSVPPPAAVPFNPGMVIPGPGPGPGAGPGPGPGPGPDPEPPLPPIPEPATWAMLLAGFFTIGVALRWRTSGRLVQPVSVHAG